MFRNTIFSMEQQFVDYSFSVSFFFELLSQFLSTRQAICDLGVMSFEFSSVSLTGLLFSFQKSFVQQHKSCEIRPRF